MTCLQKNILGNDKLPELEPSIHPKVCKVNAEDENAVFTMVPQLPSKYLHTTFIPIYLIFVHIKLMLIFSYK